MRVLIVGSGGREHAITWKAAQSPRVERLFVAPGNAGTAALAENVPIRADDIEGLVAFAREHVLDLVIVGPEGPLALGLVDALQAVGVRVFGPTRAAAQIEASKSFAKAFMMRHQIPTGRYLNLIDFGAAVEHLWQVDYRVVIKASGLAAGKGVILPETPRQAEDALRRIMLEREFGDAGTEVVIEERLEGEEVSLLAFTDGITVKPMPPARDHKRLRDRDQGPNTGGMGAYAPAPLCPPAMVEELTRTVLQPTVDGMRAEGYPFVGVLYAGLMLTAQGPRVLEFNCRFGDPETQALMPLLGSDLVEIADACVTGRLADARIEWKEGAAACVVLAAEGYPERPKTGATIQGLDGTFENATVFHSGTCSVEGRTATAGGRVLGVTGRGADLDEAIQAAYRGVDKIHFDGMQYRRDIGRPEKVTSTYAAAGVDIHAGNRAVDLMRQAVRATYGPEVVAGIGAFGGMFSADRLKELTEPVLVASTDGVGTKVKLAMEARRYDAVGCDIVNHCVNDILVQGARPLFFLDYVASSRLDPEVIAAIVGGMAGACREAGCALIGGETAEMPGVYQPGAIDIAGTIVGVVERAKMLPRRDLRAGDVLIGLASSGPHTNGYSLIRKVFAGASLDTVFPELGVPLADALLAPHRSYLRLVGPVLESPTAPIKALAHLTGGGFDNIGRVLPEGMGVQIQLNRWEVPPLFRLIQARGQIAQDEMYRVFNMGIGMVAIVAREHAQAVQSLIREPTYVIGELVPGDQKVILDGI